MCNLRPEKFVKETRAVHVVIGQAGYVTPPVGSLGH